MITVYLYGSLKQFGETFELDVRSPAEVVRALATQIPGFEQAVKEGNWHVFRGAIGEQDSVGEEALTMEFGAQREVHLMPAIEGANAVVQIVTGIALVAVGFMIGGPMGAALMAGGAGMGIGGVVAMTMKPPVGQTSQEPVDQNGSFLFNKPVNMSTQGVSVPRGYGRVTCGSIVISASLTAEQTGTGLTMQEWMEFWMRDRYGAYPFVPTELLGQNR